MAKVQRETLMQSIMSTGLYQWKQGKILRRSTGAAIFLAVLIAGQTLQNTVLYELGTTGSRMGFLPPWLRQIPFGYWIVGLLDIVGGWVAFRLINYQVFADFLIDVELEMTKVTWPSWAELRRATVVVLGTMFIFSALLLGYDVAWKVLLEFTGVLRLKSYPRAAFPKGAGCVGNSARGTDNDTGIRFRGFPGRPDGVVRSEDPEQS